MTSNELRRPSAEMVTGAEGDLARQAEDERMVTAARADFSRFKKIVGVLTHHGFHQFVGRRGVLRFLGRAFIKPDDEEMQAVAQPERAAIRFRKVLEELGPTFIKLGQVLSTRADLLPPQFIHELEKLQDDAAAVPFEAIKETVERQLGRKLREAYRSFDEEPLAAASMAQVHRAVTHSGRDVVVKVIRPGIEDMMKADLDLLHLVARLLEATFAELELYAAGELVQTFDVALKRELDLTEEATVLQEFRENMAPIKGLAVPEVFPELSGPRVLTLEFFDGKKLSTVEKGTETARKLVSVGLEATFKQIFQDGLFHGDPHP
ncbi:MAG: AarF/ABC1/UbiB kinase family protein, partial [Myxococcales bacterium]|nr:AarF/ABC1/UbiB kinase family protein [Myxococcales bacterium]